MTDSTDSHSQGISKRHYRLTNDEWRQTASRLRFAELKVLYHLRTLDPFGDRWLDIEVTRIANDLGLHKGTVSHALRALAASGDIDLEISTAKVRLISRAQVLPTDNLLPTDNSLPTGHSHGPQATPVACRQHLNDRSDFKAAQGKGSKNGNVPITKDLLKEQQNTPTHHPIAVFNEQEGDLVQAAPLVELLELIAQAGISPNKTIQKTLVELQGQLSAAAARRAVENALSAFKEQQQLGNVRNPGGMLVAALRRGYTANTAKQQARQPSPDNKPLSPPDLVRVAMAIEQALRRGDRPFALAKLQGLWEDGWPDSARELCHILHPDWGFVVSPSGGVQDTQV